MARAAQPSHYDTSLRLLYGRSGRAHFRARVCERREERLRAAAFHRLRELARSLLDEVHRILETEIQVIAHGVDDRDLVGTNVVEVNREKSGVVGVLRRRRERARVLCGLHERSTAVAAFRETRLSNVDWRIATRAAKLGEHHDDTIRLLGTVLRTVVEHAAERLRAPEKLAQRGAEHAGFLPIARAASYDRAMVRTLVRALALLLATTSAGCLYADVHAPLSYGSATPGDANGNLGAVVHGSACNTGILWLVAFGDGGFNAAVNDAETNAKAAFLVDVKADTSYKNILFGVYQRQCTEITARVPGAPPPQVATNSSAAP